MSPPSDFLAVRVDGGCMSPALRQGEQVLVRAGARVRPGDVVLVDVSGVLHIHRLVGRAGPWHLHRGDRGGPWGLAGSREVVGPALGVPRQAAPAGAHAALLVLQAAAALRALGALPRGGGCLTKLLSRLRAIL